MNKAVVVLSVAFLPCGWSGCGGPAGAGSLTINQRVVAYGIGREGVAFAIFTDIPASGATVRSGGRSGLSSSEQGGSISPASGPKVTYAGDSVSLRIGDQKFPLAKGRVFLAATRGGKLSIQQLDIPIDPTELSSDALRSEVSRIAEEAAVKTFMNS